MTSRYNKDTFCPHISYHIPTTLIRGIQVRFSTYFKPMLSLQKQTPSDIYPPISAKSLCHISTNIFKPPHHTTYLSAPEMYPQI